jgi:hypothetical protein
MLHRIASEPGKPHLRAFELVFKALYIIFSLFFGIFLLTLPWQQTWENNSIVLTYPQVRAVVANSFFKGAILGLGIVNILIGIQEIVQISKASKDDDSTE